MFIQNSHLCMSEHVTVKIKQTCNSQYSHQLFLAIFLFYHQSSCFFRRFFFGFGCHGFGWAASSRSSSSCRNRSHSCSRCNLKKREKITKSVNTKDDLSAKKYYLYRISNEMNVSLEISFPIYVLSRPFDSALDPASCLWVIRQRKRN